MFRLLIKQRNLQGVFHAENYEEDHETQG